MTRLPRPLVWLLGVALLLLSCTALALLVLVIIGPRKSNWTDENIAVSKSRGNVIIRALKRYRKANGVYPASLDDLVPKYAPLIEPPIAGFGKWEYRTRDGRTVFDLAFKGERKWDDGGTWFFDSTDGQWCPDSG